jgi:hypothetical protein
MPLALTCPCGARFEAEEALAGQTVHCPECQQPLKAPSLAEAPRRTSLVALASAFLALVGAFTVIGSALAALLGLVALGRIARSRGRLAGSGLAAFGVIAGAAFTALTLFALSRQELLAGLGGRFRDLAGADIDTSGPLEVVLPHNGFAITRPSEQWGRAEPDDVGDAVAGQLVLEDADLVLVHPGRRLYVDVRQEDDDTPTLEECQQKVLTEMQGQHHRPGGGLADPRPSRRTQAWLQKSDRLPAAGGLQARELLVDARCAGQRWTVLVRLYKARDGGLYVVRAFARHDRFPAAQAELRQALNSFRVLKDD